MMNTILDTTRTMTSATVRRGRSILSGVAEFHEDDLSARTCGSAVLFAEDYHVWHGDDCDAWLERVCAKPDCARCAEKLDLLPE